jgi:hypothetical protein
VDERPPRKNKRLCMRPDSSDETRSARLSERRADLCNSNEKELRMSRNILEALLYAALAIVHFIG